MHLKIKLFNSFSEIYTLNVVVYTCLCRNYYYYWFYFISEYSYCSTGQTLCSYFRWSQVSEVNFWQKSGA